MSSCDCNVVAACRASSADAISAASSLPPSNEIESATFLGSGTGGGADPCPAFRIIASPASR